MMGDSVFVRDYILNELKNRYQLSVQVVSPSQRRCALLFRNQILEGSQCNAALKDPF